MFFNFVFTFIIIYLFSRFFINFSIRRNFDFNDNRLESGTDFKTFVRNLRVLFLDYFFLNIEKKIKIFNGTNSKREILIKRYILLLKWLFIPVLLICILIFRNHL